MADDEDREALLPEAAGSRKRDMAAICDPSRFAHRMLVLALMCFLGFGSYFCYDNPAALQTQVQADMKVNTADFMQLYAFYSWPNVVLCFFGGFLIDRVFGIRLGTIIFSLFVCAGQVIFATGALVNSFLVMEVGRLVFGIGGESLAVAQNTYAVSWFKGKELNLVFGLQLSMARVANGAIRNVITATCEVIKITDVKDFSLSLWLIFIICVCYYVAVFPFIGLGKVFFIEKFQFSPLQAGAINSVVYIISAPLSPVLGFMVDRLGKNIIWVMCAVVATLASHLMLAFTFWNPWIAMSLLGVSYSLLACALWPMVAFVVPEHQLGTAYGFMQSIQNLGLAIIAIVAGVILDSRGYLFLEVFFSACLCMAIIAVVMLYFVNLLRGGDLNLSAWEREKLQKQAAVEAEKEQMKRRNSDWARIRPMSAFAVRVRYLSRLGAQLPEHYCSHLSSLAHRSVLK
ncbi:major facilitator superfamily domain-containing protein 1 [Xenopus laevis]|uniref:Lysosomal dipeptide transporter MFSD1 n=1 Tax=Xenopus laevis TaxID=8355 RepID=A0A8J0V909_XENLA|nr:major facilitator superfamily domain-containing protein 1 [Xenopus laevis]